MGKEYKNTPGMTEAICQDLSKVLAAGPHIPAEFIPGQKEIAEGTPSSARPWSLINRIFLFPENNKLKGLKILDVGGGCSDATANLLGLGADAYAIDPQYVTVENIENKGRWFVKEFASESEREPKRKKELKDQQKSLDRFILSIKEDPSHYIAASATNIPFNNDFFDIVFSNACLTGHLDVNLEIFRKAFAECVRVTKFSGSIQLSPWVRPIHVKGLNDPSTERGWKAYQDLQINNQLRLLLELMQRKDLRLGYYHADTQYGRILTLIAVKVLP